MDSSGKKYKPYKYAFKTELSKAPPVLPKAPKSPGKPDKKLHPGFQMSLDKVRGFAKCNECDKPPVVYSKLKLGGNDVLYFKQKLGNIQSKNKFNCGTDISSFFKKRQWIATKIVTVDRLLSCNSGIKYQYYQSVYKMGSTEQLDLCAFCGTTVSASDSSKLKKLLAEGHKVLPSWVTKDCLGMNPKANQLNGWTLTEKQTRKRKRMDQPPKKPKKQKPAVKKSAKKKSWTYPLLFIRVYPCELKFILFY